MVVNIPRKWKGCGSWWSSSSCSIAASHATTSCAAASSATALAAAGDTEALLALRNFAKAAGCEGVCRDAITLYAAEAVKAAFPDVDKLEEAWARVEAVASPPPDLARAVAAVAGRVIC